MSQEPIARILARYKDRNDLAELSRRLNISYSSLARILNENDPYDLGVRKLVDFIEAAGRDFTLLDHIEARLGRAAIPVQAENRACDFKELSRLARESGHAITAISEALADGKITKKEAEVCIKETLHVVQVAMRIIRGLADVENDKAEI
jgi:hypothetical protein